MFSSDACVGVRDWVLLGPQRGPDGRAGPSAIFCYSALATVPGRVPGNDVVREQALQALRNSPAHTLVLVPDDGVQPHQVSFRYDLLWPSEYGAFQKGMDPSCEKHRWRS